MSVTAAERCRRVGCRHPESSHERASRDQRDQLPTVCRDAYGNDLDDCLCAEFVPKPADLPQPTRCPVWMLTYQCRAWEGHGGLHQFAAPGGKDEMPDREVGQSLDRNQRHSDGSRQPIQSESTGHFQISSPATAGELTRERIVQLVAECGSRSVRYMTAGPLCEDIRKLIRDCDAALRARIKDLEAREGCIYKCDNCEEIANG